MIVNQMLKSDSLSCRTVKDLVATEYFIGLHMLSDTTASTLYSMVKDALLHIDISLDNCRGMSLSVISLSSQ